MHVWVFVNVELPVTARSLHSQPARFASAATAAWETEEGRAAYEAGTLDHRPLIANEASVHLSPYAAGATAPYRVELAAEAWRREHLPLAPSRLSAIFAFESHEQALAANEHYGWSDDLRDLFRFRVVEHDLNRLLRANGEVIQCARAAYRQGPPDAETEDRLWRHYFNDGRDFELDLPVGTGVQRCSWGYVPELLIEGVIELDDEPGRGLPEAVGPIAPPFR